MNTKTILQTLTIVLFIVAIAACSGSRSDKNPNISNEDSLGEITREKELTQKDLENKNADELLIMRNEIFARHGYKFKNNFLAHYFAQFDWYKPQYDNVDEKLSETEKKNLELIIEAENKLKGKDVTFESLVALFDDISHKTVQLNESYDFRGYKSIDNIYLTKYFGIEIYTYAEGCYTPFLTTVGLFYIPDAFQVALVCKEDICPATIMYIEYPLYIFNLEGEKLAFYRLAYDYGGAGDFTHTEAEIRNGEITKYIEHNYWDDEKSTAAEPYPVEEKYNLKVIYDPETNNFTEERL